MLLRTWFEIVFDAYFSCGPDGSRVFNSPFVELKKKNVINNAVFMTYVHQLTCFLKP